MDLVTIKGNIYDILPLNVISDKFKKQEFVVEIIDATPRGSYTEYVKMQCVNEKINMLEGLDKKDFVAIRYKLGGRKFEKDGEVSYYTNINVMDINVISRHATGPDKVTLDDNQDYSDFLPGLEKDVREMKEASGNNKDSLDPQYDDLPF